MRLLAAVCAVFFFAVPVGAANTSVTLYLDCALVVQEFRTVNGFTEVTLPTAMRPDSLRIKPLDGSTIRQVELIPLKPDQKLAREAVNLAKRRDALKDRLHALDAREAIFKAAAKSQSGKSPRKTKTEPDPLTVVRKGTEFAIAQLEDVYRARRVAENDLKTVEAGLTALNKEANGHMVRIRMSGKDSRLSLTFLRNDLMWIPYYDFRLDNPGEANVVMHASLPKIDKVSSLKVVPAFMTEAPDQAALPVSLNNFYIPEVATFTFPVDQEKSSPYPVTSVSFNFTNSSRGKLPKGEASCYLRGEYLGKTVFKGAIPNEVSTLTFGK